MPYFSVSSSTERCATASLRSRVNACACSLSSSMVPTTSAAPYAFAIGTDALELLLAVFEVDRVDDALALAVGQRQFHRLGSVVSIMIGALILRISFS